MKKTRCLAMVLALMLLVGTAVAETSFPLTQEPVTLSIMSRTPSFYPNGDLSKVENMVAYEEMTGVHIEWENVDPSVFTNTLAASIASDELPDIILKGNVTNAQSFEWGQEEILVDISPYLEEYAPNFWALMEQYPDIRLAITAPNGAIYGLPQVVPYAPMRVPAKMYVSESALEIAGMEMPTDTEELYDLLIAVRDGDVNGNGEKDEVPLVSSVNTLYRYFYGTFGVRTRGAHHNVVDVDPETNELRVFATSDNYRKFLEYLHKLYSEKLIYQEIYTEGEKNVTVLSADQKLGVILATTLYAVPTQYVDDWTGVKWQLKGPDGYQIVSEARSNLHTEGNFAITSACENVPLALQWVDYFYSPEGSMFYHEGVEGTHWEVKADGTRDYTDEAQATRTDDMTQDAFLAQFGLWPGGRNPSVMMDTLWGGEYEDEPAKTAYAMMDYVGDIVWPIFSWSEEENEVINTVQGDLQSYITSATAQVIAGEVELTDEWWTNFVSQVNAIGADKLIAAYQSAVTRIYGEGVPY